MREYLVDLTQVDSKREFHKAVAEGIELPEYYGNNIDALHDVLMEITEETQITFRDFAGFSDRCSHYANSVEAMLMDLTVENEKVIVIFEDIQQFSMEELEGITDWNELDF